MQYDDIPDLLQENLELSDDSHDVWGERAVEDRGEDVERLAYSLDGLFLDEIVAEEVALRQIRGNVAPLLYLNTMDTPANEFRLLRLLW